MGRTTPGTLEHSPQMVWLTSTSFGSHFPKKWESFFQDPSNILQVCV
jgi:hypothetical protein